MDFGHVTDPDAVDLRLPPDHPITARTLARWARPAGTPARLRAGLSVWNRRDFIGPLYPADTVEPLLTAYARIFDTIELNSSFHHPPAPDVVAKWLDVVPEGFRFVVKIWKNLSHQMAPSAAELDVQLESARAFGPRLGLCFAQLPPQAGLQWRRPLARLLDALAPHVPLAIELRHPDWFRVEPTRTRLLEHLAERGIGLVITDTPAHRELVHMALTTPRVLVRFRGMNGHRTDGPRVDAWAERAAAWAARGLDTLYFAAHTGRDQEIEGVPAIARWIAALAGRPDVVLSPPPRAPDQPQLALL